jgi:hypothetical protein
LGHIIIHPLTNLGPYPPWRDSLESLVTYVLGLPFLCYRVPQARVLRLIRAWNLSLPDTPLSAVFFPRYAESGTSVGPDCATFPSARSFAAPALSTSFPCSLTTGISPPYLRCHFLPVCPSPLPLTLLARP